LLSSQIARDESVEVLSTGLQEALETTVIFWNETNRAIKHIFSRRDLFTVYTEYVVTSSP
jgi:hypothetical protein